MTSAPPERPHIQAIYDLKENYSSETFLLCHRGVPQGDCQRFRGRRPLGSAEGAHPRLAPFGPPTQQRAEMVEEEADLMAIVLRNLIELRFWTEYISTGPEGTKRFLNEVNIDIQDLHAKMGKAFPGALEQLPPTPKGRRIDLTRVDDNEENNFKLCSKLIHATALTINHPEATTENPGNRE